MSHLPTSVRPKLPFTIAGIFVGLRVPSIHSLGTLLLAPVEVPAAGECDEVMS